MEGTMEITIWSLLAEDAAGCLAVSVSHSTTIGNILLLYCSEKGIQASSNYILSNSANKLLHASKSLKDEHVKNGEILMLSAVDEKEEINSFGNWWMVTCLSLFIGIIGLTYVLYLFLAPVAVPEKHGIVIDAGSSHSHLFIFNWYSIQLDSTEDLRIIHECYMPGGIAQYRSRIEDLMAYFGQCLHEAKSLVPQRKRHETPLILGATAGMRILRQYDPDGASMILSEIRKIFITQTGFKVKENDVFIVSGQREGINGWTAVNYLFDSFWQDDDPEPYLSALDLGGASVQVSTYIDEPGKWPTVNVSLFNSTYRVCSKSFLCYGIVKAHYRYEYLLSTMRSNKSSNVIENPCLPAGLTTISTKMDINEPCVLSDKKEIHGINTNRRGQKEAKYISKYISSYIDKHSNDPNNTSVESSSKKNYATLPIDQLGYEWRRNGSADIGEAIFTLKGTSDANACQEEVRALFDYSLCKKTFVFGDCLNHKRIPPYSGELVGYSSIFFFIFPLLGIGKDTPLHKFEAAVMDTCSKNYSALRQVHPDLPEPLLEDLCFDVMYVYTLLTDGLAITPMKWKNIRFAKQVKHQNVVWALGLMLNRTSLVPLRKRVKGMAVSSFVILTALFSACLLTSLLFMFNTLKLKRKNSSYQRVLNGHQQRIPNA